MRLAQLKNLRMLWSFTCIYNDFCRPHTYSVPKNLVIATLSDVYGAMTV